MLSIKVGTIIFGRLEALCEGKICPEKINELTDQDIKSIGTSYSKVKYIRCLTDAVLNGTLDLESLSNMDDNSIYKVLMSIHGIGRWTAKMYLIFVLDRQDILPYEDVAFLQGYRWMYKTDITTKDSVLKKCAKWKPYSSIAARYLYRALDMGLTTEEFH